MKKIERTYLNFTFTVCVLAALFVISQNWKNQLMLHSVRVYGNQILTNDEVKGLAGVQTLSGSPLYKLNLSMISQRVEQNAFVRNAVVVRALPYDLTITVNERSPIALVATSNSMLSIDREGIVLPVPFERRNNMPVIVAQSPVERDGVEGARGIQGTPLAIPTRVGRPDDALEVGDTVKGSLMQAVKFVEDIERLGPTLSASIAEVQVDGDNLVAYTTVSSLPVIIGRGDFHQKLIYLQEFLTKVANTDDLDYNYVDLRFDGQIVVGTQRPALSGPGPRLSESPLETVGKAN